MTTSAVTAPRALTAYLRRATWGLPPARQQELWDELEEHVLTRTDHLTLTGLSPTQAMTQAIHELGPPTRVTLGMAKVYTMPKLLLAAGTLALAVSAGLYALAGGGAAPQITLDVVTSRPVTPTCVRGTKPTGDDVTIVSEKDGITCYTFNDATNYQGAFVDGIEVARAVNAQGGHARLDGGTLSISLPGRGGGGGDVNSNLYRNGRPLFDAATVIGAMGTSLPIEFRGYAAPEVQIGSVHLRLGTGSVSMGRRFYNPLNDVFVSALKGSRRDVNVVSGGYFVDSEAPAARRHHILTPLTPGEVVLLVTKRAGENYMVDSAEVAGDRTVALQSEASKVKFVSSLDQLGPYPSGGRITALLVRVSNIPLLNLKSGIFVPAQATSDAR